MLNETRGLLNLRPVPVGVMLLTPIVWLALLGVLILPRTRSGESRPSFDPPPASVVGAGLALLIGVLSPLHVLYNLQSFAAAGTCLAAVAATYLHGLKQPPVARLATFSIVLLAVVHGPLQQAALMELPGNKIGRQELRCLASMAKGDNTNVVALLPPIPCSAVTPPGSTWRGTCISQAWIAFLRRGGKSPRDWKDAVIRIESAKPAIIVNAELFGCAWERGILSDAEYRRVRRLLDTEYVLAKTFGTEYEVPTDVHCRLTVHRRKRALPSPVRLERGQGVRAARDVLQLPITCQVRVHRRRRRRYPAGGHAASVMANSNASNWQISIPTEVRRKSGNQEKR